MASAICMPARAQLINVELLGVSLTAPVTDVLADVNLLSGQNDGMSLLSVEVLGPETLLGVGVSGQDILLLGAPVDGVEGLGDLSGLTGDIDSSQGAVLEFLQDTAMGDINPTILTLSLPGSGGEQGSEDSTSNDNKVIAKSEVLTHISTSKLSDCVDNDRDSVCDSEDQCLDSPAGAIVLPSGCHFDRNRVLSLQGVTFDMGTAVLAGSSVNTLRQAAQMIRLVPDLLVQIAGHTDDVGSEQDNQTLSEQRARAVKNYLIEAGVAAKQLVVKGYGELRPLVSIDGLSAEALSDARASNRRVELRILDEHNPTSDR